MGLDYFKIRHVYIAADVVLNNYLQVLQCCREFNSLLYSKMLTDLAISKFLVLLSVM